MATLENWFQKKDYEEGLLLLAKYSKNRMLIQNLTKKTHPGKLEYELKKIAVQLKVYIEKKAPKPQNPPKPRKPAPKKVAYLADVPEEDRDKLRIVRGKKNINPDDLPEDLKKLWDANRDAYKEIRALHEKLKLMEKASDEDRQPLTDRISKFDEFIRENWELIDAWQPGSVKGPEKNENGQKIDHKRINANRKYISTNLKKLQAGLDEKKAEILKDNLKIRYNELLEAGEKLNQETIDDLTKAGVI